VAKGGNWVTDKKGQPSKLRVEMSEKDKKAIDKARGGKK
jgi:hypothetical protein